MGILDSVKNLVGGKKRQVDDGIDKAAVVATDKVGEQHADTVDQGADLAKDAVEKLPE